MEIPQVTISSAIREKHAVKLGLVLANVAVSPAPEALNNEYERVVAARRAALKGISPAEIPAIRSARKAYKAYGKDPSRYRPSAEALLRRVLKGEALYRINNVVDLLNLVSVQTGISIGGYNLEKVNGKVELGIGRANEPYQAIGRGGLNMEGLPLLRDETAAFGCPTSDSVRTSVDAATRWFWMVLFDFGDSDLEGALQLSEDYLRAFGGLQSKEVLFRMIE